MNDRHAVVALGTGVLLLASGIAASGANGAGLTPGNIIFDNDQSGRPPDTVYEYTTNGAVVKSWSIPNAPSGDYPTRGVAVDSSGNVQIFNGTGQPWVATLNPSSGTVTQHQGDFSAAGVTYIGGIAALNNYIFVSDYNDGASTNNGIVRFDTSNNYAQTRFRSGFDYDEVSVGANGLLYAVNDSGYGGGRGIDVINPSTGTLVAGFATPGQSPSAVVADAQGHIFSADLQGSIYEYSLTGTIVNSRALSLGNLLDIAISPTGQLAVTTTDSDIVFTDTTLSSETFFHSTNGANFVAFTSIVPEPSLASGAALAGFAVLLNRRRRADSTHRHRAERPT